MSMRIDVIGLDRVIARFSNAFSPLSLQALMRVLARNVVTQTRRRIQSEHKSPDGGGWAALAARTAKQKGHSNPLFRTGAMMNSLQTQVSSLTARISTSVPYAAHQQYGTKGSRFGGPIPARPFMGVSAQNGMELERVTMDFVTRQLSR
jgi:phage virion morphogenesis protein